MIFELNNFSPFQSEVWGNVSDWLILFATAVTGLLIWRTLNSQLKIQEFEKIRLKRELLPKFYCKHTVVDNGVHILELTPNSQPFYEFNYSITQAIESVSEVKFRATDLSNTLFDFDSPIMLKFRWDEKVGLQKFVFSLNIYYEDQMGHKYVMLFAVHSTGDPFKIGPRDYNPKVHSKIRLGSKKQ